MGGLDAPGFRIEVVGPVADVLRRPQRVTLISVANDAARGVGR